LLSHNLKSPTNEVLLAQAARDGMAFNTTFCFHVSKSARRGLTRPAFRSRPETRTLPSSQHFLVKQVECEREATNPLPHSSLRPESTTASPGDDLYPSGKATGDDVLAALPLRSWCQGGFSTATHTSLRPESTTASPCDLLLPFGRSRWRRRLGHAAT